MKKILFSLIIVALIVVLVLKTINFADLFSTFKTFPYYLTVLGVLLIAAVSLIKSLRLYILLRMNTVEISFWQTVRVFITSQAFTILPGGEVARAQLVKKECGASIAQISPAVLLQAVTELLGSAMVVIVGCLFYPNFRVVGTISTLLIGLALFVFIHPKLLPFFISKLSRFPFIKKNTDEILDFHTGVLKSFYKQDTDKTRIRTGYIKNLLLCFASIFLGGILVYLIAYGFKVPLDIFQGAFIYAAGTVITGLSGVMPGGIGITETGMSGLLIFMGIVQTTSLAIVLIYRAISLVLVVLVGLVLYGWYYKFSLKE